MEALRLDASSSSASRAASWACASCLLACSGDEAAPHPLERSHEDKDRDTDADDDRMPGAGAAFGSV